MIDRTFSEGLLDAFCKNPRPVQDHDSYGRCLIVPTKNRSGLDAFKSIFDWMKTCQKARVVTNMRIGGGSQYFKASRLWTCATVMTVEKLVAQVEDKMTQLEESKDYISDLKKIFESDPVPAIKGHVASVVDNDLRGGELEKKTEEKLKKIVEALPALKDVIEITNA